MIRFLLLLLMLSSVTIVATQSAAQAQQKGRTSDEGAVVYAGPSFDAEILGELPPLTEVIISKNKFEGVFHRTRFSAKLGYISDHQVKLMSAAAAATAKPAAQRKNSKKVAAPKIEKKPESKKRKLTDLTTAGIYLGQISFVDEFSGSEGKAKINAIGFDITGPEGLVYGVPLSTKIIFSGQSPSYYPSGSGSIFLLSLSTLTTKPLAEDFALNYGLGFMFRTSSFNYKDGAQPVTIKRSNLGLTIPVGFSMRVGSLVVRPEAQFFYEKKVYWSGGLNLSYAFRD